MGKKLKITPQGKMILVLPLKNEDYQMGSGIIVANTQFVVGEVVELSPEFKDVYKQGDVVMYPKGAGNSQPYKGESHLWINGNGYPLGDVTAIVSEEKKVAPKKRLDNL